MHVANPKSTRGNRSIAASCEPIKTASVPYPVTLASWSDADADADTTNEGGSYPFSSLSPLPAVSGAAGWGAKKGLDAATRKKRVGKISWAQAAANQRLVRDMRNRWLKIAGAK